MSCRALLFSAENVRLDNGPLERQRGREAEREREKETDTENKDRLDERTISFRSSAIFFLLIFATRQGGTKWPALRLIITARNRRTARGEKFCYEHNFSKCLAGGSRRILENDKGQWISGFAGVRPYIVRVEKTH